MKTGLHIPQDNYIDFMLRCMLGITRHDASLGKYLESDRRNQIFGNILQLIDALLNNPYEKIIITDREGKIIFINDAYCNTVSVNREEAIGRHVIEVLGDNTRLHIIGKTLKPELHGLFHTNNTNAVARRYPLISQGKVFGVLGKDLFDNLDDLFLMARNAEGAYKVTAIPKLNVRRLELANRAKYSLNDIISKDAHILRIKKHIKTAAQTTSTILITGETGVGKELFAHAVHKEGSRANGPFIRVNCAALPESLLESELFGYEEGAFTGARKGGKPGKFELAKGGTIFLDEIAEIPLHCQAKILRVLQEKEIERVGGIETVPVDVRVVAATNKDLKKITQEGAFRKDLYYRINIVPVRIPPLRERLGDIPLLVSHFIDKYNEAFGLKVTGVSSKVMKKLERYHWPGNVRELETVIESAMNRIGKSAHKIVDIPPLEAETVEKGGSWNLKNIIDKTERDAIRSALQAVDWNMEEAANVLEISLASLYRKINKHNIR